MKKKSWEFPGGPLVKGSELLLQGAWVLSLVGELRFHKAEQPNQFFFNISFLKNLMTNIKLMLDSLRHKDYT